MKGVRKLKKMLPVGTVLRLIEAGDQKLSKLRIVRAFKRNSMLLLCPDNPSRVTVEVLWPKPSPVIENNRFTLRGVPFSGTLTYEIVE